MTHRIDDQFSELGGMIYDLSMNRKFLGTNPTLDFEFATTQGKASGMADTPAGQLLMAIMERAYEDLKEPKLRKSALVWIENHRDSGVCSFVFIAREILGCDPKKLREAMVK